MPEERQSILTTAPNDWNQKGMRQPAQQLVAAILENDRFGDYHAKPGHAIAQPFRHATAMQRQLPERRVISAHRPVRRPTLAQLAA